MAYDQIAPDKFLGVAPTVINNSANLPWVHIDYVIGNNKNTIL